MQLKAGEVLVVDARTIVSHSWTNLFVHIEAVQQVQNVTACVQRGNKQQGLPGSMR